MNYYTLAVYKKQNKPCFVVTINHIFRAGVFFFLSLAEAKSFIAEAKKELEVYAPLKYDSQISSKEANLIHTVISCDNIKIGTNGKTYYQ